MGQLIVSRASIHGFLVFDWWHRRDEALRHLPEWQLAGKLRFQEDVQVRKARGTDSRLDAFTDGVERRLGKLHEFEPVARRIVEMMAFALQGSLLVRYSTPAVAEAF